MMSCGDDFDEFYKENNKLAVLSQPLAYDVMFVAWREKRLERGDDVNPGERNNAKDNVGGMSDAASTSTPSLRTYNEVIAGAAQATTELRATTQATEKSVSQNGPRKVREILV